MRRYGVYEEGRDPHGALVSDTTVSSTTSSSSGSSSSDGSSSGSNGYGGESIPGVLPKVRVQLQNMTQVQTY